MQLELGLIDVVPELSQMRSVSRLRVAGVALDENSIAQLGNLTKLECLSLESNDIHGDCLEFLRRFKDLKCLSLRRNFITDEDMSHLACLARLEELHLDLTEITGKDPDWLLRIGELEKLQVLSLRLLADDESSELIMKTAAAQITRSLRLHNVLPSCTVHVAVEPMALSE
jgi:hypothetical protein